MTKNGSSGGTFRNLSVDLGSRHARPALEVLLKMEKRRNKVRSARVFSKSGYIFSSTSSTSTTASSNSSNSTSTSSTTTSTTSTTGNSGAAIAEIFELLSRLPNLKYLTVDFHHFLPLQALCFLSQSPRLKELVLEHVQLSGDSESLATTTTTTTAGSSEEDISPLLSQVLSNAPCLQEISLLHCRGASALESFFKTGLPNSLKKLTIANTPMGTNLEAIGLTMAQLGSNPHLQTLKLYDVPNLNDIHIQTLVATGLNSPNCALQELEFTSNLLGATAGLTIMQGLTNKNCCKLEHLKLHLDWEDCGPAVATMLQRNNRLKQLDLRLYGDDDNVRQDAILIAQALQTASTTSALKRLRLCMEMEPGEEDEAILDAFEQTLQTNLQLKYLELDDSIEDFPLPLTLQSKLKLNRSGAPKLWRRNHHATHEQFVQAIVNQRDDLNTIYHILREEPTICCMALLTTTTSHESNVMMNNSSSKNAISESDYPCCFSDDDYLPSKPNNAAAFPRSASVSPKSSRSRRARTKRFIRRKVRSIFATSA